MLKAHRLTEVLHSAAAVGDGVQGVLLFSQDGELLGSTGSEEFLANERIISAITSNVWEQYSSAVSTLPRADSSVSALSLEFEQGGKLYLQSVCKGYVVCLCGDPDAKLGMLRSRAIALANFFAQALQQVTGSSSSAQSSSSSASSSS